MVLDPRKVLAEVLGKFGLPLEPRPALDGAGVTVIALLEFELFARDVGEVLEHQSGRLGLRVAERVDRPEMDGSSWCHQPRRFVR